MAERCTRKTTTTSCIMSLYAKRCGPKAMTHVLWHFAIAESINMENNFTIEDEGQTILQKSKAIDSWLLLRDQHVWGCPTYVLEIKVQASSKVLPKWYPRDRIGVCLGSSPYHAGNISPVLIPSSGHVYPQFHLVFDDDFTLIPALRSNIVPLNWVDLVAKSTESVSSFNLDSPKLWFN